MYKKILFIVMLLVSASLLAACGSDTKTSTSTSGGAVAKSATGCRSCHGVASFRVLPDSHAGYTNDMCLGCHSEGYYSTTATTPNIPHPLGKPAS